MTEHNEVPSNVSFLTRLLIKILLNRKDVMAMSVEILLPEIPESNDDAIDRLLAEQSAFTELFEAKQAADKIDTLNRIYNTPYSGKS